MNRNLLFFSIRPIFLAIIAMVAFGCGCGEQKRSLVDEGLAAEALENWEEAWAKYEEARETGDGEGSQRLAEWMILRGQEEVFGREPKDAEWLASAREWRSKLQEFGSEAEAKGYAVEGLSQALEKYDAQIGEAEERIRLAEEEEARREKEAKQREERTSKLIGLRLRRSGLVQKEARLEAEFRETWKEYDQFGEEWLKDLVELVQEEAAEYNHAFSSHKMRINDRYKRLRKPQEEKMTELQKELADIASELQECSRELAENERTTLPKRVPTEKQKQALQENGANTQSANSSEEKRKLTANERAAMWEGW